jgi:L-lactate dehydrogenase complex protein LldE
MAEQPVRVALFVTCLVDFFRPSVGFAAVKLLEQAGCQVEVPDAQTCCGQPAYNSGHRRDAAAIAADVIRVFAGYRYVVAPSGSCAGMIKCHYPSLFAADPAMRAKAEDLAARTFELTSFLTDVMKFDAVDAAWRGAATYHDSCSGLRELGVKAQPRRLLASVRGLELKELRDPEACCGFGGTFCVKYGAVSAAITERKAADIAGAESTLVLAGDLGCLMNMAGRLRRDGQPIAVRHVAEVLAGMTDQPPIGEAG